MNQGDERLELEMLWHLRIYVVGGAARSQTAVANLQSLCEHHFGPEYRIEVVDLSKEPKAAQADQVIVIPTTVRVSPLPKIQVIGDLSDAEKAKRALGLPTKCHND